MANFNKTKKKENCLTYEGGKGYKRNSLKAWLNFLMGSYFEPQFYEDRDTQLERFIELTNKIGKEYGPEFVAKCAAFSRDELGLRSVSQLVAAIVNSQQFENKRVFFRNFCVRPDDVAEIFAAIDALGEKRSHALVRGASDYLSSLGDYQIGKYKLNGKDYNMYDLINITHAHSAAIDKYKAGTLESPDTWEVAISNSDISEEERDLEWIRLVKEEKLGYMALLRNLRNILKAIDHTKSQDALPYLRRQLTDNDKIRKSRVFPYRIYTAWKVVVPNDYQIPIRGTLSLECQIRDSLSYAFSVAAENVPMLDGNNVAIIDVSGSMDDYISENSEVTYKQAAACQAMTMILKNPETVVIKFGTTAKLCQKYDQVCGDCFSYIDYLVMNENCGYGTDLVDLPNILNALGDIDRIFLYSDFQAVDSKSYWFFDDCNSVEKFSKTVHSMNANVYSFDLSNYSNAVISDDEKIMYLSGLNDRLYSIIPLLEDSVKLEDYISAKHFN